MRARLLSDLVVTTSADRNGAFALGIDVGGTFTDLVLTDSHRRVVGVHKVLTTPDDPARAVLDGVMELLASVGIAGPLVETVVHGTTLATNAIVERKGAPTGLLITRGFRDILEMGTEQRYDIHDLFLRLPDPLVPRQARLEVRERITAGGAELEAVDEASVGELARTLARQGVRAIAIVLLHSYADPGHERRVEALVRDAVPGVVTVASHRVAPEIREYERASTTVANAYLVPVVGRYLEDLEQRLRARSVAGRLYVMLSDGGTASARAAAELPVRILESGPAGGALAAAHYARQVGAQKLLSFDMGGTTAKVCLIRGGVPAKVAVLEVARLERFKPGSGLPIRAPAIDLLEIGGGGGSIARVDRLGLLKVGPASAGADPGPACYARTYPVDDLRPTVTDAAVVLGYLSPDAFLGGRMQLDVGAARRALDRHVAGPLGIGTLDAAWGIYSVVSESMAVAARMHCIEHATDPRSCTLFAFGGAGPVHAARIARILGMPRVICPPRAGVASAFGFLVAPLSFSASRSLPGALADIDRERLAGALAELEASVRSRLEEAGVDATRTRVAREVDLSLVGQSHELRVPVPDGELDPAALGQLEVAFHRAYRERYGHPAMSGIPVQALTWRVTATEERPDPAPPRLVSMEGPARRRTEREAFFPEAGGMIRVPVHRRSDLGPGVRLEGPAIVEEDEATTVIGLRQTLTVDDLGDLVIDLADAAA